MDVIREMQAWKLVPEAYLVEPGCDLSEVVQDALAQGIRMFVVCGGDGTISAVARALAGTRATLGIIPTGTQNNVALSLGIPADIPAAVAILRTGRRIKVDVGMAACRSPCRAARLTHLSWKSARWGCFRPFPGGRRYPARQPGAGRRFPGHAGHFPAGRDTPGTGRQAGDPQLWVTWCWSPTCPTSASHYRVGAADSFNDGLLDVLFFADLSKLDLLGYVFQGVGTGGPEDPRIQHYRVRRVEIDTHPAMPVMADGNGVRRRAVCRSRCGGMPWR